MASLNNLAAVDAAYDEHCEFLLALHDDDQATIERIDPAARAERTERRRETADEMAARMRPELSPEMREVWIESRR
jgi:hypothetical protein